MIPELFNPQSSRILRLFLLSCPARPPMLALRGRLQWHDMCATLLKNNFRRAASPGVPKLLSPTSALLIVAGKLPFSFNIPDPLPADATLKTAI